MIWTDEGMRECRGHINSSCRVEDKELRKEIQSWRSALNSTVTGQFTLRIGVGKNQLQRDPFRVGQCTYVRSSLM